MPAAVFFIRNFFFFFIFLSSIFFHLFHKFLVKFLFFSYKNMVKKTAFPSIFFHFLALYLLLYTVLHKKYGIF